MTLPTTVNTVPADFERLQAAFRQQGHTLGRSHDAQTRQVRYFVSAWGFCKHLSTLEEAQSFLQQIGGAHASH